MIKNILYYLKHLVTRWHETPKEIRYFTCFICNEDYMFPLYSMDYVVCNNCFKKL
jgi:hypothetical protein